MIRRRTRRRRHPQLHLPPLDGHEALLIVAVCERIISAVWRAHGEDMGDILIEPLANRLPPEPCRAIRPPSLAILGDPSDDNLF